jgi:heat shock protein HslJ
MLFLFGLLLFSVSGSSKGHLEDTRWQMKSYRSADGDMVASLPDLVTTARFEGGTISGNAGCNSYRGNLQIDGETIMIGPLMTTMMACPEAQMKQESTYLLALEQARTFERKGDRLLLFNEEGQVLIAFTLIEPSSLTETNWTLIFYNDGSGAMQSLIPGTEITAEFSAAGIMSGSAGCNNYSAEYEASLGMIAFSKPASTRMTCPQPAGLMEQENRYLAALEDAARYSIEMDRLEIRDRYGSGVATYLAIP